MQVQLANGNFHTSYLVIQDFAKDLQLKENPDKGLVEVIDNRPLWKKTADVGLAVFNHIQALFTKHYRRFMTADSEFITAVENNGRYVFNKETLPWADAQSSTGLYLLIHGLRASPTDWNSYSADIKRKMPDAHILVPNVPLKGNCPLKKAAKPFVDVVHDYLEKFPGNPVTFIGTSNGGRASLYIESKLDPNKLGSSRLSVVSLAGVHYGTRVVNQFKALNLDWILKLNKELSEEFTHESAPAKKFLAKWHKKQEVWSKNQQDVRHFFGATTEDEQVRDLSCSLPFHTLAKTHYHVVSGYSHRSCVEGMRPAVMQFLNGSF